MDGRRPPGNRRAQDPAYSPARPPSPSMITARGWP